MSLTHRILRLERGRLAKRLSPETVEQWARVFGPAGDQDDAPQEGDRTAAREFLETCAARDWEPSVMALLQLASEKNGGIFP